MRFFLILITIFISLNQASAKDSAKIDAPSWYLNPKQNNEEQLYGVAEGFSLEESTKYALADIAARLIVSISSESSLIREENQTSVNEEMRQQVQQNVEKINFTNFSVTNNSKIGEKFYTEVAINRAAFIQEQQEQLGFLDIQINNLEKNLATKNTIQKRNNLIEILNLEKDAELKSRILTGLSIDVNLKNRLAKIAEFKNQLNLLSDKIEIYFAAGESEIARIIRTALNKEKIKVVNNHNAKNLNEITISIKSQSKSDKIYEAFITKLMIDFTNSINGKIIASNNIEVSGSSVISEAESKAAALQALDEEITKNGVVKIIGILN